VPASVVTEDGAMRLLAPMMGVIGRRNLRDTANALEAYLQK
jgi:hypothetical protein